MKNVPNPHTSAKEATIKKDVVVFQIILLEIIGTAPLILALL